MDRRGFLKTAGAALALSTVAPRDLAAAVVPVAPRSTTPNLMALELEAIAAHRNDFAFWKHLYRFTSGHILIGDQANGELLGALPIGGNWKSADHWRDPAAHEVISGISLSGSLAGKRRAVRDAFEDAERPILDTRAKAEWIGRNLPNEGKFIQTIQHVYRAFDVGAGLESHIGPESGFSPTIESPAGAFGLSQWMPFRWDRMREVAPYKMWRSDRFSQVEHSAAYLRLLQGVFNSPFIGLSMYQAGETNGSRLMTVAQEAGFEGSNIEQYLQAADFMRYVRERRADFRRAGNSRAENALKLVDESFGPQSWLYVSIIAANTDLFDYLAEDHDQEPVFRFTPEQSIPKAELRRAIGWNDRELRHWNPHVVNSVDPGESLYTPRHGELAVPEDTYWTRPVPQEVLNILGDWDSENKGVDTWNPENLGTIDSYIQRFKDTRTRQGEVFATVMAGIFRWDVTGDPSDKVAKRRHQVMDEYRTEPDRLEWTARLLEEFRQ